MSRRAYVTLAVVGFLTPSLACAGEPFRYADGRHGKGELRYVRGLPVLSVEGTPEEMGEQTAALTLRSAAGLLNFPRAFLRAEGMEATWPALVLMGRSMLPHFPAAYRRELDAGVRAAGLDRDLAIVANTMFDIKKLAGCSVLLVEADRSATGGPLLGRNLDFPTLGYLQQYSLVVVARPKGKHAFASVGFPGLLGCLSGMNDAGLALATLEVATAGDGSARFDPTGTPYALCYRRLLEECTSVDEAEKLLRSMKRTTSMNLAVCDRRGGAVLEMTPKTLAVRRPREGIGVCTNHFRTRELATDMRCRRYAILARTRELSRVTLGDVARKLDAVSQGALTLQAMIFEPAELRLHLALGQCPASSLPLEPLDLAPYLGRPETRQASAPGSW